MSTKGLILLLCFCCSLSLSVADRDGKLLSLFNVVRFPNDPCGDDDSDSTTGVCYTQAECDERGGKSQGTCAQGFGVCCQITLTCGEESRENNTYFTSEDLSSQSSSSSVTQCSAKVCPANDDVVQLRLDFVTFDIAAPETTDTIKLSTLNGVSVKTGKEVTNIGQCLQDRFSVTNPGGVAPPVICGKNDGQHLIVDASEACNELNFVITSSSPKWNIRVTQYDSSSPLLAPAGCTQYFTAETGSVKSFNFEGDVHLANQNQNICVRTGEGKSRICWTPKAADDFQISGAAADTLLTAECCNYGDAGDDEKGYDCLIVPEASTTGAAVKGSQICGRVGEERCSTSQPFQIRFLSDAYEFTANEAADLANLDNGINLEYEQE